MTKELISEEKESIYDLEIQIKAYQVKIDEEKSMNLDHSA